MTMRRSFDPSATTMAAGGLGHVVQVARLLVSAADWARTWADQPAAFSSLVR